ncbi:ShlB/FhaC/HecB family hemolysin secretion/activation protein [Comamonadaceae bacterium PP-2]
MAAGTVLAQPDPAQQQQQQRQSQRDREQLEQLLNPPEAHLPATPPSNESAARFDESERPCVVIRQLRIAGIDSHTEHRSALLAWLRPHADGTRLGDADAVEGKCLGARGIEHLLARLQDALIERGYITSRVYAPPQDLADGELVVTLVPGRIRTIRLAAPVHPGVGLGSAFPMAAGDLLRLPDVEQGLENLKRVPTAEIDIRIEPGQETGQSDVVVTHDQGFPLRGALSLDNSGSKAAGKHLAGLSLAYDNGLALNDLLHASLSGSVDGGHARGKATRSALLHYSVPYGYWLSSASYSNSNDRRTFAGASRDYLYRGNGSHAQLGLSRVLWRHASQRLDASIKVFRRRAGNYIDDVEIEVQQRATAGWELGLNHRARLGSAVVDAGLTYRRGTGAFGALASPEQAFGEGSARFRIWGLEAQLAVPWRPSDQRLSYSLSIRGQFNRTPLAPQERFAIGGRYTVRGFDGESSLSADRGWLLRNEVAWALGGSGQQIYLGLDWGRVDGQAAHRLTGHELAGTAIGLRGGWRRWQYDVFVGRPLHRPAGFKTARHTASFSTQLVF